MVRDLAESLALTINMCQMQFAKPLRTNKALPSYLILGLVSVLLIGCSDSGTSVARGPSDAPSQELPQQDGLDVANPNPVVSQPEAQPEQQPEQQPETQPDSQPDSQPESQPEITTGDNLPEAWYADPGEMELAWQASLVRVPDGFGGVLTSTVASLESGELAETSNYPVVIYSHGCSGFWSGTRFRADWYARQGFVVIAPLSLARSYYPTSCNLSTHESGLYRPTLQMRQNDLGYAIEKVRSLPWSDVNNLFLVGLSEGGAAVAMFDNQQNPALWVNARIIEGWGCHAGWQEFEGLNAPAEEAVLSFVADEDPWYQREFHQGNCGEFMMHDNGSRSIVIDQAPLRFQHALFEDTEIQNAVLEFLNLRLVR